MVFISSIYLIYAIPSSSERHQDDLQRARHGGPHHRDEVRRTESAAGQTHDGPDQSRQRRLEKDRDVHQQQDRGRQADQSLRRVLHKDTS